MKLHIFDLVAAVLSICRRNTMNYSKVIAFQSRFAIVALHESGCTAMASLGVRNLDDELLARLKRRAARHGRSAEAKVRTILRQALNSDIEPGFEELAAAMRQLTAGRVHTLAEILLRESRDER